VTSTKDCIATSATIVTPGVPTVEDLEHRGLSDAERALSYPTAQAVRISAEFKF